MENRTEAHSVASHNLKDAECKYAQAEKEAFSIIFGVRKCHKYLYSSKFVFIKDHKPLLAILGTKVNYFYIGYVAHAAVGTDTYGIEYRKSADHANADVLSRLPRHETVKMAEENQIFYFSMVDDLPVCTSDIARSARKIQY